MTDLVADSSKRDLVADSSNTEILEDLVANSRKKEINRDRGFDGSGCGFQQKN